MRVQGEAHMLAQDEVRFRAQDDTRFRFPGEARSGGDGGSGLRAQEAAVPRRIARADQQQPSCGDPRSADFPLGTRVHGGPASYQPGGAGAEWYVDLTNDTDAACHDIHPILLLVDRARNLQVAEVRTEFYDTASDSWRPVPLVRTDEDELIGVFGEGTPGFTVGAGRTVSVQVRLAFTEAARINSVVATTAVVQRKDADGEWVGRSGDYRFSIDPGAPTGGRKYPEVGSPYELARSGPKPLRGLGAAAVTLVVGGGALVLGARRAKAQTAGVRPARPTDVPH